MRTVVLMSSAAVAYVMGGIFMKLSLGLTKLMPSILLFVFFAAGAALQALSMYSAERNIEMGPSYVWVLGLEAILAFMAGLWIFSEPATLSRIVAVALIATGILLLRAR